ncbi:kinase-like protein [Gonapodya prolifera JEL478]|uniref:Kinase-like protein n=1 Tax=Gonapodya prolifera (strain JEL478) TaxID=1344416 RepID=A0A139ARL5_GONPJ|nr:kinase-like protein [Gonapodya prolifera JEL478]|eukprot:KXS19388.1 kinase-like protein [Gonapodya prolifera JEL478]
MRGTDARMAPSGGTTQGTHGPSGGRSPVAHSQVRTAQGGFEWRAGGQGEGSAAGGPFPRANTENPRNMRRSSVRSLGSPHAHGPDADSSGLADASQTRSISLSKRNSIGRRTTPTQTTPLTPRRSQRLMPPSPAHSLSSNNPPSPCATDSRVARTPHSHSHSSTAPYTAPALSRTPSGRSTRSLRTRPSTQQPRSPRARLDSSSSLDIDTLPPAAPAHGPRNPPAHVPSLSNTRTDQRTGYPVDRKHHVEEMDIDPMYGYATSRAGRPGSQSREAQEWTVKDKGRVSAGAANALDARGHRSNVPKHAPALGMESRAWGSSPLHPHPSYHESGLPPLSAPAPSDIETAHDDELPPSPIPYPSSPLYQPHPDSPSAMLLDLVSMEPRDDRPTALAWRLTVGLQDTYARINRHNYAINPPHVLPEKSSSPPSTSAKAKPTPARGTALATHTANLRAQLASLGNASGSTGSTAIGAGKKHQNDVLSGSSSGVESATLGTQAERHNSETKNAGLLEAKFGDLLGGRYQVVRTMGEGSFGRVFEATDTTTGRNVAVKVMKTEPLFAAAGHVEVNMLKFLRDKGGGDEMHNIVRLLADFLHGPHLCLVYELLHDNLYDYHRKHGLRGMPVTLVRSWAGEVLKALGFLGRDDVQVIHCDVKPENILLKKDDHTKVKLADFGSSVFSNNLTSNYIQSRFYRAPEVMLGYFYTTAVDMWSLGCVLVELVTGKPLFYSENELDQMHAFQTVLSPLSHEILDKAPGPRLRSEFVTNEAGRTILPMPAKHKTPLKTLSEIFVDRVEHQLLKRGLSDISGLEGTVAGWRTLFWDLAKRHRQNVRRSHYEASNGGPSGGVEDVKPHANRCAGQTDVAEGSLTKEEVEFNKIVLDYLNLFDLVSRMLTYDPSRRIRPEDALRHTFFQPRTQSD